MYPTMTDQLREIRRVLADVVLPELSGTYAGDTLSAALATLQMLEGASDRVLLFLRWDNAQLAQLLVAAAGLVDDELAGAIGSAVAADPIDPADFAAVHRCNLDLRALLATAVPALAASDGPLLGAVTGYFRDRIARYPFISTAALPTRK